MPGVQVRLGMKKQKLVDLKSFWHVECCSCAGSDQKNLIEQLIGEVQGKQDRTAHHREVLI